MIIEYQSIDDYGGALGNWKTLYTGTITGDYFGFGSQGVVEPVRKSAGFDVPLGRYKVRLKRTNIVSTYGIANIRTNTSMALYDTMTVDTVQSYIPGEVYYNQSVVAIRVKATELAQASANSLKVILTRKLPIYNRTTKKWSAEVPTRRFAAAISAMLRQEWGGNLADSKIDLDGLWRMDDEKIYSRSWTFDGYFDGNYSVWQIVNESCKPFRVVPRISSGIVDFAYDETHRPVKHRFTTSDIVRDSFQVTYATYSTNTPDDVILGYLDEEAGFQTRDVQVTLPRSESRTPATLEYIGMVKREQAFRAGVFIAACNRYRRINPTFQTERVGRLVSVGDVCTISHPFFTPAQSGKIIDWDESQLAIALDKAPVLNPQNADSPLYLSLDGPAGAPWGPCLISVIHETSVMLDPVDYANLLVQGQGNPFDWLEDDRRSAGTTWILQYAKQYEGRAIITAVNPVDRFHYSLDMMNDSEAVDEYNDIPVPAWKSRGSIPAPGRLGTPTGFVASASGSIAFPTLALSWTAVPNATMYDLEIYSFADSAWIPLKTVKTNAIVAGTAPGEVSIRVTARNNSGNTSVTPGRWNGNTNILLSPPPELVLSTEYLGGNASLAWDVGETETPVASYTMKVYADEALRRSEALAADAATYAYTAAAATADGGPWRRLRFEMETLLLSGLSLGISALETEDVVPGTPDSVFVNTANAAVVVNNIIAGGEYNGYVILRGDGPDFAPGESLEQRVANALPYRWGGLTNGTAYYFRFAAKDSIYDLIPEYRGLNYTEAITLTPQA